MKTTLDGVVFFVAARVKSCKNGVSPQADFPRTEGRARKRHAPSGRILPNPDGGAAGRGGRTGRQDGSAGRSGKTDRQDGAAGRIGRTGRQDGAAGRSGRTERQDGAAGRSGRTERQDGAAGRSGRTGRQDGAAGRSGRTGRQKKRGRAKPGHRSGQIRGAAHTNKKTGETIGPARFSTGIPTAGSRRTAKKRTEKRPGICKRPTHRFSIRCSDTGKGAILSARPPLVK